MTSSEIQKRIDGGAGHAYYTDTMYRDLALWQIALQLAGINEKLADLRAIKTIAKKKPVQP